MHATRCYLGALDPSSVVAKLDFANAFNIVHRFDMLQAVKERLPELYPYVYSAYSSPTVLFYGPYTLLSQEGPQQGDPLWPLLFCNTINPVLSSMQSAVTVGYQDDITLGGPLQTVASDVRKIAEQGARMGLVLNASKCELIAHSKLVVDDSLLGSFTRVTVEESSLLGAPMFPGKTLDEVWSSRCVDLTLACDRLGLDKTL